MNLPSLFRALTYLTHPPSIPLCTSKKRPDETKKILAAFVPHLSEVIPFLCTKCGEALILKCPQYGEMEMELRCPNPDCLTLHKLMPGLAPDQD